MRNSRKLRNSYRSCQGRSAILWGLVSFIAFQAVYHCLSSHWPQLYDGQYGIKLTRFHTQLPTESTDRCTILMLGSSLTGFGFNPSVLETDQDTSRDRPVVFNFSLDGGGPVVELICLRRLLAAGIRPSLLLIESHPHFLFSEITQAKDRIISTTRLQLSDLAVIDRYDRHASDRRHKWWLSALSPWDAHRENLLNVLQHQPGLLPHSPDPSVAGEVWRCIDHNGWYDWNRLCRRFPAFRRGSKGETDRIATGLFNGYAQAPLNSQLGAYDEIAELCKQREIALVLVRMPEMSCVHGDFKPEWREKTDQFYTDLAQRTGMQIVDARAWVPDEEFWDGFHITAPGGTYFTKRLEAAVIKPFVSRQARSGVAAIE